MSVKTITITEEAYGKLARLKREGESFSDVIKRALGRTRASDLAGILRPEVGDEIARGIKRTGREADREVRRTLRKLKP